MQILEMKYMDRIKTFLWRHKKIVELIIIFCTTLSTPVVVNAGISPEWEIVYNKLAPWVGRVALLFFFAGAIDFGIGIGNEDPNGKVKGTAKMIAGVVLGLVWNTAKGVYGL